ncbi:MAG TPA: hypothetical protein VFE62_18690 [Gemmataceae bacterium]|nr:hypothetical protein [Gemmataceae bacterium]
MKNTLLVVGNDKIGARLLQRIPPTWPGHVVLDCSSSVTRVLRLLRRGSLPVGTFLRMAWANAWRPQLPMPEYPRVGDISSLLEWIDKTQANRVFLFRAGLIISQRALACGAQFLNTHCARVPEYGGIGAIARALADRAFLQVATLHHVTTRIDEGEVLDTQPYCLRPERSYRENEDLAYDAGIELLAKHLDLSSCIAHAA